MLVPFQRAEKVLRNKLLYLGDLKKLSSLAYFDKLKGYHHWAMFLLLIYPK